MAVKLSSLRGNAERVKEGHWQDALSLPGVELKVRGVNYGPYRVANSAMVAQWISRYKEVGRVPPERAAKDVGGLFNEYLLLDWRGFDEKYSREIALEYLSDPLWTDLRDAVLDAATRVGQADIEFVEDAAKNSERSSDGRSEAVAQMQPSSLT